MHKDGVGMLPITSESLMVLSLGALQSEKGVPGGPFSNKKINVVKMKIYG